MKRFLFTAALLTAATSAIIAHTLDGIVKDHKTGEPLIGTIIRVKELPSVSTTTGLDGTFTLRELPDRGRYTLVVSSWRTRQERWWSTWRKTMTKARRKARTDS